MLNLFNFTFTYKMHSTLQRYEWQEHRIATTSGRFISKHSKKSVCLFQWGHHGELSHPPQNSTAHMPHRRLSSALQVKDVTWCFRWRKTDSLILDQPAMVAAMNKDHARCPILDTVVLDFTETVGNKTQTNSLKHSMNCQIRKLYFSVV